MIIAIFVACLILAYIALQSVPSTKQYPQTKCWYPTTQSEVKEKTSQTIPPASQAAEAPSSTNRTQNQPKEDNWTIVERRLPDSSGWQAIFDFLLFAVGCVQIAIYQNMRRDSIAKDRACVFVESLVSIPTTKPHETRLYSWRFNLTVS